MVLVLEASSGALGIVGSIFLAAPFLRTQPIRDSADMLPDSTPPVTPTALTHTAGVHTAGSRGPANAALARARPLLRKEVVRRQPGDMKLAGIGACLLVLAFILLTIAVGVKAWNLS